MSAALPPRLLELLAKAPDRQLAQRLQAVHTAAAVAITALGELDLIQYEGGESSGSADLSLWEQLAPTVASTISAVNGLLAEIDQRFPPAESLKGPGRLLHVASSELRQSVAQLGMSLRDPSIMGERWGLLNTVQAFRSKVRGRIGTLVFETVSPLGECRRSEVDPGWLEEVTQALAVRSGTTELRMRMTARLTQICQAPREDVPWHLEQLMKELDAFGRAKGWLALRAPDKQTVLEFKALLESLPRATITQKELADVLEPFVDFTAGLKSINQRGVLLEHDREILAMCGVAIEQVMSFEAAGQLDDALKTLIGALRQAKNLYGRDDAFDVFLRQRLAKKLELADLTPCMQQFLTCLGALAAI